MARRRRDVCGLPESECDRFLMGRTDLP